MRVLPTLAIFLFAAGLSMLVAGLVFRDGDTATPQRPPSFDHLPTVAPEGLSAAATVSETAVATPTPFVGRIARMVAPGIGLDSPVEEIGFVPGTNQLDAPADAAHVGWYGMYPLPGGNANALFAAHVNFNKHNGPFVHLADLQYKAIVSIEMENGPTYDYEVIYSHRYDVDTIAMGDLIEAHGRPADAEWITLITCGGDFQADPGSEFGHYLQRDVVIAQRIER